MPNVTHQLSTDPAIEAQVQHRYKKEIEALRVPGFEIWFVIEELLFPFSLLISLIILPLFLIYRQTFRVKSPLRLASYDQVLKNPSQGAIAILSGLGVKFYTQFTDSALLVSGMSTADTVATASFWYYPIRRGTSMADAWRFHQQKVDALVASGKQIQPITTFEDYLKVDRYSAAMIIKASLTDTPVNQRTILKVNRYLYLLVTLVSILSLLFLTPVFFQAGPVRGIGYFLFGLIITGNMGMATWDAFKGRSDDLFFFPKTARWAKTLAGALLIGAMVTLLLQAGKVIPNNFFSPLAAIWFIYESCFSLYFRIKRQFSL
jgi:hypothetical protein